MDNNKTHNERYEELQNMYLETRDKKILSEMYLIALEAAENYIRKYCRGKHLNLDFKEKIHDAAMYCIEPYLRKPDFRIKKLSLYIYFGVIKNLFKDKDHDMNETSYETYFNEQEEDF
jgi:hypothetical protein